MTSRVRILSCRSRRVAYWRRSCLLRYIFGGERLAPCRAGIVCTVTETTHTTSRKENGGEEKGGGGAIAPPAPPPRSATVGPCNISQRDYAYVQRVVPYVSTSPQRVLPCLYVFVSLVFVLTASATSQHNTPQQVGVGIYKDSTTINSTCCKDLSVNAFFHVRATHPTQQGGSLPLAKNAKHSSSNYYVCACLCVTVYAKSSHAKLISPYYLFGMLLAKLILRQQRVL